MSAIRTYFRLGFKLSGNVNKHKVSHGASTYHERFRTYISIGRGHGLDNSCPAECGELASRTTINTVVMNGCTYHTTNSTFPSLRKPDDK